MMNEKRLRPKFLEDSPIPRGLFDPLENLAKAVHRSIENHDGGRAMSLFGTWGSGKSSIIEFLKSEYSANTDRYIFIFDGWSHEGNPLRRVFLEELINGLINKNWLSVYT